MEREKKKLKIVPSPKETPWEDHFFEIGEEDSFHHRSKKPNLKLIKNVEKLQAGITGELKKEENKIRKVIKILKLIRGKEP